MFCIRRNLLPEGSRLKRASTTGRYFSAAVLPPFPFMLQKCDLTLEHKRCSTLLVMEALSHISVLVNAVQHSETP